MFSALLLCSLAFAESKPLAMQIALDRAGFSCNTIDGVWGRKSEIALAAYERSGRKKEELYSAAPPSTFNLQPLFRIATVTLDDLNALVKIPTSPAERANLPRMGYESIKEMFAERGHLSQRALERLNPGVDWDHIAVGTLLVIPDFPSIADTLKAASRPNRTVAERVEVSLTNFTVTVYGKDDKVLALFPCSIARSKSKLPPAGELKIVNAIARPNYTYTPDFTPAGKKPKRYVWPEGENCPIGVAWLGLNLPGYGIHGTPKPVSSATPNRMAASASRTGTPPASTRSARPARPSSSCRNHSRPDSQRLMCASISPHSVGCDAARTSSASAAVNSGSRRL